MILAHQIIASIRANADPAAVLRQFYATTVLTVGDEHFTPSQFIGGYYNAGNRCTSHPNWVNSRFEKIFNPVIGRALCQRPTLAKIRFVVPEYPHLDSVDPYELLLCYSPDNIEKLLEILTDVSSFIKEEQPSTKTLGLTIDSSSGIAIMYHSLWSPTLPMCHLLPVPPLGDDQPDVKTDTQFAALIRFLVQGPTFKSTLSPPVPEIDSVFYLVGKNPYYPLTPPFPLDLFDKTRHVYPDILWFQPYSKNPSALNFALTLGLLIETGDIDAVTIPTPNIGLSLTENNSRYFQGLITLGTVHRYIPSTNPNVRLRICKRSLNGDENQPVCVAFRHASRVVVPRFGTEPVRANMNRLYGVTVTENCNDNETHFTYAAWKASEDPPLPCDYTYPWSSYRYVSRANTSRRKVFLYYTLRHFYGENVTLSRTRNPVLLLP